MHVLIATDGSQTAVDAARRAAALLNAPDHVTLLTMLASVPGEDVDEIDEPALTPEEQARRWETELREVNHELERTASVVAAPKIDTRVEAGDVAWTIPRVAREVGADVIVVGSHMRHGLRRVRRSVAEHVVRDAPCVVLVVPDRENGA